jgi:hypothetical protein
MTDLFDKNQFGSVLGDIKGFTCNPSWLKISHFQGCAVKLKFIFGSTDLQRNCFRLGGFGRPIQKLQLGITRSNALGIDWAPRVFGNLQKQQLCAAGFERNLFTDTENKRFVQRSGRRKPFLCMGNKINNQQYGNQDSGFHGSRLSAEILIDMRKQMTIVHSRI